MSLDKSLEQRREKRRKSSLAGLQGEGDGKERNEFSRGLGGEERNESVV